MKEEEVDGKKIINALIANSESWNKRTKFSQAKFIKMKRIKQYSIKLRKTSSSHRA